MGLYGAAKELPGKQEDLEIMLCTGEISLEGFLFQAQKQVIPVLVARETKHHFANLQEYAKENKFKFEMLENLKIGLLQFAINSIVKSCPDHGSIAEVVTDYREPGTGTAGKLTDRFFRNGLFAYCHIRNYNKEGVANELEQVIAKSSNTRVYMFKANRGSLIEVSAISPDGRTGCKILVPADQVKEVLELIY